MTLPVHPNIVRRTHPADTFGFAVCLLSILAVGGVFIWRFL